MWSQWWCIATTNRTGLPGITSLAFAITADARASPFGVSTVIDDLRIAHLETAWASSLVTFGLFHSSLIWRNTLETLLAFASSISPCSSSGLTISGGMAEKPEERVMDERQKPLRRRARSQAMNWMSLFRISNRNVRGSKRSPPASTSWVTRKLRPNPSCAHYKKWKGRPVSHL